MYIMSVKEEYQESCVLCGRTMTSREEAEKHHLIPRVKKGKETIRVCVDCGNQIHRLFTNVELKYTYNSLEALKQDPRMQKWIKWVRKRPFGICHKTKKKR